MKLTDEQMAIVKAFTPGILEEINDLIINLLDDKSWEALLEMGIIKPDDPIDPDVDHTDLVDAITDVWLSQIKESYQS